MDQHDTGDHHQAASEQNRSRNVWTSNSECVCPGVSEKSVFEKPHVPLRGHLVWTVSPRFSKNMGVAMEVARLSHRKIDKSSINP